MIESLLIISMAVTTVSLTVARSKIFEPFRSFVQSKSKFLGELFSCFYCLSHWVAIVMVYLTGLTTQFGFIVTTLSVIGMSAIFSSIILGMTGLAGNPHQETEYEDE